MVRRVDAYVWHDLSPVDGCSLVSFTAQAESLAGLTKLVSGRPGLQNTTVRKLLNNGHCRKASPDELEPAAGRPGRLFWRNADGPWHDAP